jgi:hypothetical protein
MTEEVDPRLVALGLVPAPPGWREQQQQAMAGTAPLAEAPPASTMPNPFAEPYTAGPSAPGELFAGMGKFTGMPAEAAPAQPAQPPEQLWSAPAPAYTPPPEAAPTAPAYQPPAYTPPTYDAPAVAPRPPETPTREAPPPLPPLASARPTARAAVEAPPLPQKKEKPRKEETKQKAPKAEKPPKAEKAPRVEKAPKAERAPKPPKPERVKPPPKPRFILPPSGVLLRGPVVMGYPEKKLQITLEQLGFRIDGKEPIDVAWTDVKEIKSRRGRVSVRLKGGRPVNFGIPVEGVAEPTLAGPLSRVVKEASGGSLDLAGSSFLELQNATDSLRDHYHDEDDPLIPTVVGLVFVLAGLTVTALLPDSIAIATRTPIAAGAYLIDSPLSSFDPRILLASFAAAAMLASGVVRIAMGKAATGWARGTLRGWHEGSRRPIELARRGLASIILNPAMAAAVLLVAFVLSLPSARVQTVIEPGGFHIMREIPFFDEDRPWSTVSDITTVPAPTMQHFEGIAVVFKFNNNKSTISTLNSRLRGGTDKQLLTSATQWWEGAAPP